MLERIFKTFIPPDFDKDIHQSSNAKNLVGACIVSIIASPAYAVLYFALHFNEAAYAILLNEIILLMPLLILKYYRALYIASMVFVGSLVLLLMWLTYHLGGIYSQTSFWLVLPPLIATFIGGMRLGSAWCFITILCVSTLYYLESTHYVFPIAPITDPLTLQYLTLCGLDIVILSLVYFYEMGKEFSFEKLRSIAYHDTLTGLPNRMAYVEIIKDTLSNATAQNTDFAIYYLDIDNFKKINTVFNQEIGNLLLCEIAQRIKNHMPPTITIARLSADDFKIIVVNKHDDASVKEIANILLATMKIPFHVKNHEINITASIGVSTFQAGTTDGALVDRFSDVALSTAKNRGGNNYQYFDETLAKDCVLQIAIEKNLPNAIANNELRLNFQLLFDGKYHTKITGYEVLLRWTSKNLGEVSPDIFIPIAEKIDLISRIGEWVLIESCKIYMEWYKLKLVNDNIPFAINISPQQLYNESFIATIKSALLETGIPPANLIMELTESSLVSDQAHAAIILQQLRDMGIRIVIDDFGTGQTSLSYLAAFPVSGLKIDRAFVHTMLSNNSINAIIIQSVVDLAHRLNLEVVSEGVENIEQLNYLKKINCDHIQGFYLSKPFDADSMRAFLEEYRM